ncbi:MAG: leucyl aminopeptidase [Rhodobacteraceae bacterium HLUCCA12]|nr:MAG: leucyl aminopeptidase [Rhodobacteraceae bacterium HLUCCA12]
MTLVHIDFASAEADALARHTGRVVAFADESLDPWARRIDRLTRGALKRAMDSEAWSDLKPGEGLELAFPAGMAARAVHLIRLPRNAKPADLRKAGATIGRALDTAGALVAAASVRKIEHLAEGIALRAYAFARKAEAPKALGDVTLACKAAEAARTAAAPLLARADAVHFSRDLVNEPANILTTVEFAKRLEAMRDLGLEVEVLDEADLHKLGMQALLAVGQGSESPSQVVVMQWKGGGDAAPLALVGKGVVFDTGGISIKPAAGMEDMTMDMGGAGVVAGVMRALAARKAKANVVGLVGLVENMPDGRAQRPGDVVTSMKGDTIEVINTDAEGRLVLADVMWYAQDRFKPAAMVDLATLTGAVIIGLGHEKAGVFGNDDGLCADFLKAAEDTGEGAWRLPLDPAYDAQLKSRIADMKNVGGRPAGSITAAQFLQRFVKPDVPWIHLDIAGVTLIDKETAFAPKGATGWGVRALDTLVRTRFGG